MALGRFFHRGGGDRADNRISTRYFSKQCLVTIEALREIRDRLLFESPSQLLNYCGRRNRDLSSGQGISAELTMCLKLISFMLTSQIRDLDHLSLGDRVRPANGYLTNHSCLGCGRVRWRGLLQDQIFPPLLCLLLR